MFNISEERHIERQIKLALDIADTDSALRKMEFDMQQQKQVIAYMTKLMRMQDNLQILSKQTAIKPTKHGYFQVKKPNGLICFSWHFELQGSKFSIINFADGTVYIGHRLFEGSVIEALTTFEKRINNFFASRIRLN